MQPKFEMLTKKCWEEQDKQPTEQPIDSKELSPYEETLPIVILLENMLSIRIEYEQNLQTKTEMAKQLTLLNLILSTHLVEGVAENLNE